MGPLLEALPKAAAAADEVLYRNERTLITRRVLPGGAGSVVLKQALGAEAAQRLRHEAGILARLAGIDGVVQLAPMPVPLTLPLSLPEREPAHTLALRDDGGTVLSRYQRLHRFDLPGLVDLGRALARVLGEVHGRGVVHKDINPSNVLIRGAACRPTLIDFNIASCAAEERPGFTHQSQIAGTLHYMAPEQTGRTGRPVDPRADLYALGVMLYELAVGRLPFEGEDLLDLIHDHLARVPAAPAHLRPQVPPVLSDLIMRLLEKEPDRRYQSAEGLRLDLDRLHGALCRGDTAAFALGEHDFALRLSPPSRPVGREGEIASLQQALDQALDPPARGGMGCLFIAGAPGVGKSALIGELRAMVTARRGWFVAGKFDPFRQDPTRAAVEPLRALGRLLLAEPEERLVRQRERLLKGLGANAGFGPALLAEFVLLLGKQPRVAITDPREAEARMIQACVDLLRSIADPGRPVVLVLDDLQWAPAMSLRLVDAVITGTERLPGLLLVGAYRANEVDAAHPLGAAWARWQQLGMAPPRLHLDNLPPTDVAALVGQMLRLPASEAQPLAEVLNEHTSGNPHDTVELVNALRQDGLLMRGSGRWRWEAPAIRRYIGHAGVADILGRRIGQLAEAARELLEVLACLGGEAGLEVLGRVTGLAPGELDQRLAPALEDGLLVLESGARVVLRFRHDRVQQAVFEGMGLARRRQLHLRLARCTAQWPELCRQAAEQYLPVADALVDAGECRRVARLFQQAAAGSRVLNYALAERFLAAAIGLIRPLAGRSTGACAQGEADHALLGELEVDQHVALYSLGRADEGDTVYAAIVARCGHPIQLAGPAGIQMYSLTNRTRYQESLALGLSLLAALGQHKPDDLAGAVAAGLQRVARWQAGEQRLRDFDRPEVDDPALLARALLSVQTANAAYFCDPPVFAWLVLEAHGQWMAHGPCQALLASTSGLPLLLAGVPQGLHGASVVARHLISVGQARGYRHGTAMARCAYGVAAGHWVEPIEGVAAELHQARGELLQAGDVAYAGYTCVAADFLFDCAPMLESAAAEVEAALALFERAGNAGLRQRYLPRRQLIQALRGEPVAVDVAAGAVTSVTHHILCAIAAAIFGDPAAMARHATLALPRLAEAPGYYLCAMAHVLQAVALAEQARAAAGEQRAALLEDLDGCHGWLAARAADAPVNFLHLLRWVEAERAWAAGDIWTAGATFERAMQEAARHVRPWHQALITERAAGLHLALGMEARAQGLLHLACAAYAAWGAAGKVRELRARHACLRGSGGMGLRRAEDGIRSTIVAADVVDMMAVLRASQALSSETQLVRLTEQLAKVVGAMTGATGVQLLVCPEAGQGWFLADSLGGDGAAVPVEQAGERGDLALSVFRYAQRTRQTLLLDDAVRDERFAADPYFAALDHCSLLCAPILSHGELRGMLMLESRQRRGAFGADRLDSLMLIAGQMSVSLNNALLYASLERKVAERTAALAQANLRLEQLSRTDALTGLANRRCFDEALEAEYLRAERTRSPLGLILIDIDFFKPYNDHYGHPGGDACLQRVAAVLATGRRGSGDLVARYGGEEFVILLPHTGLDGVQATAERVRAAVEALQEPHAKAPLGCVTVSLGVAACVPGPDAQPAQWVAWADAALYEAKRGGRNRVGAAT